MKILAIDFSSSQRSVALVQEEASPERIMEHEVVETGTQPGKPFEMIEEVLRQAGLEREQIEGLAIGLGPGSYSGIRGSIALVQGWQLAAETPVQGVSSAECIAAQAATEGIGGALAVVIDAQRGEFYLARFALHEGAWRELQPLCLASAATVAECARRGDLLVGPEVAKWFPEGRSVFPRAATLGRLALQQNSFIAAEKLEPIYLRIPAFVKAPPPRVLPES